MLSDPLLQGGRSSSHSSSKLSSSEGVWQPRKWKKRKENERKGKQRENSLLVSVFSQSKNKKVKIPITRFILRLYSAQVSKKTIIPSIPMIHEGQNWKKIRSQTESKVQSIFALVRNFHTLLRSARFSSFFCFSFLLNSDLQC